MRLFSHYQHAEKTDKVPTYFATDERTQPARIVTTEKTNILLRQFHVQAETQVQPTRRSPRPCVRRAARALLAKQRALTVRIVAQRQREKRPAPESLEQASGKQPRSAIMVKGVQ